MVWPQYTMHTCSISLVLITCIRMVADIIVCGTDLVVRMRPVVALMSRPTATPWCACVHVGHLERCQVKIIAVRGMFLQA